MSAEASSHVRRCPHRTAAALCSDPERDGAPTITWCAERLCDAKVAGTAGHADRARSLRPEPRRQYLIRVQSIEGAESARRVRDAINP